MVAGTADWRSKEIFDRAVFKRLDEETGGAGLEIAEALLSTAPARRDAMIAAAAEGRTGDLARVAHTTKSGARSLGLVRLSELCEAIEHAPPADAGELAALGRVVRQEFDAAIAVIAALQKQ